jgi:hypothetical protein
MEILIQGEGRKFKCLIGFKETMKLADGADQLLVPKTVGRPIDDGSTAFPTIGAFDAYS